MILRKISFEEIKIVWSENLWPLRQSPIEPISYIDIDGEIDMNIVNWANPVFYCVSLESKIIGVTSYFQTNENLWRLRGTWVCEMHRGRAIGRKLINEVVGSIRSQNRNVKLWTLSRKSSQEFYFRNGFFAISETDKFEFGPHVILQQEIDLNEISEKRLQSV